MLNKPIGGGEHTEAGGTFAGPTQNHILDLASQLGVDTFPTYNTGDNVYFADGYADDLQRLGPHRHRAAGPHDPSRPRDRCDPARRDVEGRAGRRSMGVRVRGATGTARRSSSGSTRTAPALGSARWCRRPPARSSGPSRARSRCCSRSSTSPRPATSRTSGRSSATSTRATGRRCSASWAALSQIAARLAHRLGSRVKLGTPVRRIESVHGGVRVVSKHHVITARRVIVAVPPALARRIRYEPGLPANRRALDARDAPGHAAQGHRRLRPAVLARRRPQRHRRVAERPGERVLRRLAARRLAGRPVRVRGRRRGARRTARSRRPTGARRC